MSKCGFNSEKGRFCFPMFKNQKQVINIPLGHLPLHVERIISILSSHRIGTPSKKLTAWLAFISNLWLAVYLLISSWPKLWNTLFSCHLQDASSAACAIELLPPLLARLGSLEKMPDVSETEEDISNMTGVEYKEVGLVLSHIHCGMNCGKEGWMDGCGCFVLNFRGVSIVWNLWHHHGWMFCFDFSWRIPCVELVTPPCMRSQVVAYISYCLTMCLPLSCAARSF